jgi:hypothetical protein
MDCRRREASSAFAPGRRLGRAAGRRHHAQRRLCARSSYLALSGFGCTFFAEALLQQIGKIDDLRTRPFIPVFWRFRDFLGL